MHISTAGAYPEVGVIFNVSYKFNKLLREALSSPDKNLVEAFYAAHGEEYSLGILLSAKAHVSDILIKGPSNSKKHKVGS